MTKPEFEDMFSIRPRKTDGSNKTHQDKQQTMHKTNKNKASQMTRADQSRFLNTNPAERNKSLWPYKSLCQRVLQILKKLKQVIFRNGIVMLNLFLTQ